MPVFDYKGFMIITGSTQISEGHWRPSGGVMWQKGGRRGYASIYEKTLSFPTEQSANQYVYQKAKALIDSGELGAAD